MCRRGPYRKGTPGGSLQCRGTYGGNGIKTRYAYDRLGNPSRIETERGSALLADLRLFHDGNGNLTRKEGIVPGADGKPQKFLTAYTWDSKNRLASAGYGDYTEAFRYDGAGNRTARTVRKPGETEEEQFFYSPSNRLERRITHLGETAYQYDSQGNLVSEEGPAGRRIHQYDAWNREEETLTTLYGRAVCQPCPGNRRTAITRRDCGTAWKQTAGCRISFIRG